jgi:hypothetical protein
MDKILLEKLVEKSKANGIHYMQPIIHIPNTYRNSRGQVKQIEVHCKNEEGFCEDHTQITLMNNMLSDSKLWNSYINNPTVSIPPVYANLGYDIADDERTYHISAEKVPKFTIHQDLSRFLHDSYSIDANSNLIEIPIYFIVRKPLESLFGGVIESSHLSVIVACNNYLYSFGYGQVADAVKLKGKPTPPKRAELRVNVPQNTGFGVEKIATKLATYLVKDPFKVFKGVLHTPDANPFLNQSEKKGGKPYSYDIIDVGVFTKHHANGLLRHIAFKPHSKMHSTGSPIHAWSYDIEFKKDKKDSSYIYPQMSFIVPEMEYKLCSTLQNSTFNCASFIEKLFPGRITCIGKTTSFSKPSRCVRRLGSLKDNHIRLLNKLLTGSHNLVDKKCCTGCRCRRKHEASEISLLRDIFGQTVHLPEVEEAVGTAGSVHTNPLRSRKREASARAVSRGATQTEGRGSGTRRQSVAKSGKSTRRSRA